MMQLKPRCQFALESYYLAEMPVQELAKQLEIKPRSLYMLLNRCREKLRQILRA